MYLHKCDIINLQPIIKVQLFANYNNWILIIYFRRRFGYFCIEQWKTLLNFISFLMYKLA